MPGGVAAQIAPQLPYLRRYARALTGSQSSGDAYVKACLEAILARPGLLKLSLGARIGLYRAFTLLWRSAQDPSARRHDDDEASPFRAMADRRLGALGSERRQMLLLTALEGFSPGEAAVIAGRSEADIERLVAQAFDELQNQETAQVLIIEDEPLIAMDLSSLIEEMGHEVAAVARTADEAVAAAERHRPTLVLADVNLADGSSGIDAVASILQRMTAPVIFITAYPERLLTGERPEPTWLITKPYDPSAVKAAAAQALFFKSSEAVPGRA